MLQEYTGYRSLALPKVLDFLRLPLEGEDLYEFGVASGKSMVEIINCLKDKKLSFNCFHGFDSFIGMPQCSVEPLWQGEWAEGNFNSQEMYGCSSVESTIEYLTENISPCLYEDTQLLKFIPGFYKDSLPLVDVESLRPAAIIDIDCDLYSSTYEVLDFMAKNRLIKEGTILIYDDWGGSPGFETHSDGESKAHKEICEKYGIDAQLLLSVGNSFPHVHTFFVVRSIS